MSNYYLEYGLRMANRRVEERRKKELKKMKQQKSLQLRLLKKKLWQMITLQKMMTLKKMTIQLNSLHRKCHKKRKKTIKTEITDKEFIISCHIICLENIAKDMSIIPKE